MCGGCTVIGHQCLLLIGQLTGVDDRRLDVGIGISGDAWQLASGDHFWLSMTRLSGRLII